MPLILRVLIFALLSLAFGKVTDLRKTVYKTSDLWWGCSRRSEKYTPAGTNHHGFEMTPFDDYVSRPDGHYRWEETGEKYENELADVYILNLTSQQWLDETIVSQSIWYHYLLVSVPKKVKKNDWHLMYLTGSHTAEKPPPNEEELLISMEIMVEAEIVGATLYQIGCEPIEFYEEKPKPKSRSEDGIIAYTWMHFMNNTDEPDYLNRFPMVKSAIRGMDATEEFLSKMFERDESNSNWMVAGASKRGWTSWLTGAYDAVHEERVRAITPLVMSFLNWSKQLHRWWKSLGGWSWALKDYYEVDFFSTMDSANFNTLMSIVDPYAYRERYKNLTLFEIQSSCDEFFHLDDSAYFFDELKFKQKYFLVVQNSEHALITGLATVIPSLIAFVRSMVFDVKMPTVSFYVDDRNRIHYITDRKPSDVKIWYGNPLVTNARDFRWVTAYEPCEYPLLYIPEAKMCMQLYLFKEKQPEKIDDYHYVAEILEPEKGYVGFFIHGHFDDDEEFLHYPLIFSSYATVAPNTFPFPDCTGSSCRGKMT